MLRPATPARDWVEFHPNREKEERLQSEQQLNLIEERPLTGASGFAALLPRSREPGTHSNLQPGVDSGATNATTEPAVKQDGRRSVGLPTSVPGRWQDRRQNDIASQGRAPGIVRKSFPDRGRAQAQLSAILVREARLPVVLQQWRVHREKVAAR